MSSCKFLAIAASCAEPNGGFCYRYFIDNEFIPLLAMQQQDDAPPLKPTMPRQDWFSAQIIEIGIAIQRIHGTYEAYKYLQSRNINTATIARTLTQPGNRRLWQYTM